MISEEAKASPGSDSDSDHASARIPATNKLQWKVSQARDLVIFELDMAPGTWMGLGLGGHSMDKSVGADMIMCSSDDMGSVTCHDMKSVGEIPPA